MRTIDLYVLRQTLKPLAIALVVALLVLLIERMLRLLDLVLGAQGPVKVVFEIMGYLVPNYISLALPLSLLLGVMLAFNKLKPLRNRQSSDSMGEIGGRVLRDAA